MDRGVLRRTCRRDLPPRCSRSRRRWPRSDRTCAGRRLLTTQAWQPSSLGSAASPSRARPWARSSSTNASPPAIGNVYKSEVCFACRVDPFASIGALDEGVRRRLYSTATRQLQANLGQARRTTWGPGLAVYGRRGQPCPRCGTPVRMARQGELARTTYWCPSCQPPGSHVRVFTSSGRLTAWE